MPITNTAENKSENSQTRVAIEEDPNQLILFNDYDSYPVNFGAPVSDIHRKIRIESLEAINHIKDELANNFNLTNNQINGLLNKLDRIRKELLKLEENIITSTPEQHNSLIDSYKENINRTHQEYQANNNREKSLKDDIHKIFINNKKLDGIENIHPVGQTFIQSLRAFGYFGNKKGMCYGLAYISALAILSNDLEGFNRKLNILIRYRDNPAELKMAIQDIRKKISDGIIAYEALNIDQKDLLEIPALFDGIELFQQGYVHNELFEKAELEQTANRQLVMLIPPSLEKENGSIEALSIISGKYNSSDYQAMLASIETLLAEGKLPVSFQLLANQHAINISYDLDSKTWTFIDANRLPARTGLRTEELAKLVIGAFNFERAENPKIKITATPLIHQNDSNKHQVELIKKEMKLLANNQNTYKPSARFIKESKQFTPPKKETKPAVKPKIDKSAFPLRIDNLNAINIKKVATHQSDKLKELAQNENKRMIDFITNILKDIDGIRLVIINPEEGKFDIFFTNPRLNNIVAEALKLVSPIPDASPRPNEGFGRRVYLHRRVCK